jgi:hypothetical protein
MALDGGALVHLPKRIAHGVLEQAERDGAHLQQQWQRQR